MRRPVRIAFQGNRRHGDDRRFGKPPLEIIVFRLPGSETEPPAIVVDHDGDVVRVVEGDGRAIERGIVEIPFWRGDLPDELGELTPVFVITGLAAFCREVVLIPHWSSAFGGNG